MLTALVEGVKGGKWFSLMDKVYSMRTLWCAWEQVRRNKGCAGVDRQTVAFFAKDVAKHLDKLQGELRDGTYRPHPVKRTWIDKEGKREKRPPGIPAVRDRIVQTALRIVLAPIFEREFLPSSYGFQRGLGWKDALREVDVLLKDGFCWVVDVDFKSFFDTIDHDRLMELVEQRASDGRILALLQAYLHAEVLDGMKRWQPEEGTPQGAVISPLLSNIYLHEMDVRMRQAGYRIIRYADDFSSVDGWVRRRLRSILRKRQKRKGNAKGNDNHRWPNSYFADHGLFSLKQAYELRRQSLICETH